MRGKQPVFLLIAWLMVLGAGHAVQAAPQQELWPKWQAHDPQSRTRPDHHDWNLFLKKYLISDHPSGIHRLPYGAVTAADQKTLANYINRLEEVLVSQLNRAEQKAYWINLYNALTVKVVLDHYPVGSIREIDISPGWFADGPWGKKLVRIEGARVSLDDIEHRILRPIWEDNRIHYAVNCASLGCPNLQPVAFTADNTEKLLQKGAHAYVNHPRGARLEEQTLYLSSIYKWFQVDFGGTEKGVIQHLLKYAEGPLAKGLKGFRGQIRYGYDWGLNRP